MENSYLLIGIISVVIFIVVFFVIQKKKSKKTSKPIELKELEKVSEQEILQAPKKSWAERLNLGLEKSKFEVWGRIGQLFSGQSSVPLDEIEEILYTADIPTNLVQELLEKLESQGKGKSSNQIQELVFTFMKEKMNAVQAGMSQNSFLNPEKSKTKVIMIVGVNGAGKTTTIGKLATKLKAQGAKVIVGACDTFRAAAVDQLQVWCERAGVEMVRAKDGADPSGVAYDTVAKAYSGSYDYCLIDTAGRLHTNQNLMEELIKTKRVMSKINSEAPQEVLLVLDAITGQNALKQAQEFHKALNLTGIIFTKCDGSAKAGSAVGIVDQLKVPIAFIGVGEQVEDLETFDLDLYLKTLVGLNT
jgi:fused signal recognition particle receptor